MPVRSFLLFASLAVAAAQFGMRRNQQEAPAGSMGDLDSEMGHTGTESVDAAMKMWQELGKDPSKMQEYMKSFKDPEVVAQANEMLNDPEYMAAAKAKLAQMQAKAKASGLLDENGQPIPGAHQTGGIESAMQQMMGNMGGAAQGAAQQAREWEQANMEKYKGGEMNSAELGMANLQAAMKDPSVLGEVAQMMKDPENMAALKKMMADPAFQAQAKQMQQQMQASGQMPDFSKLQQMMGGGMGGGGMGGGGMGGNAAQAEIERLRRENAALRAGLQ